MKKVVSVLMMRECEEKIIESGVSSRELMDRAAMAVLETYSFQGQVAIVCGIGNNAGDGYALALHLKDRGVEPFLFLVEEKFSADGEYYFQLCQKEKIGYQIWNSNISFEGFDAIVDAIYGVGFHGQVSERISNLIQKMNESGRPIVSIDMNSGSCADNGLGEISVKADLVVAIEWFKLGHFLNMAKDQIGKVVAKTVGIPFDGISYYLIEKSDVAKLFSRRSHFSNKGDYGKALLIGGSRFYCGAISLASMSLSSLKVGSGVSILGIPETIYEVVAAHTLESILYPLKDKDGFMVYDELVLDDMMQGVSSIGIGPGWGRGDDYEKILKYVILHSRVPLVIDADGLNALARMDLSILNKASCPIILSPHPKEFSRLIRKSVEEVLENSIVLAKDFAKKYQILLLLKGVTTIVTDGVDVHLVDKGTPGMATAGSGDVLTGIVTGLCSYCGVNLLTVSGGAYINGLAGELASRDVNEYSMVASDTVRYIPEAINMVIDSDSEEEKEDVFIV